MRRRSSLHPLSGFIRVPRHAPLTGDGSEAGIGAKTDAPLSQQLATL